MSSCFSKIALQHTAREKIELLRWEKPDFISLEQWPPNSPDLNLVDYKIWTTMQQRLPDEDSKC